MKRAKMRKECSTSKRKAMRKRRAFTPEFKREAVRLCKWETGQRLKLRLILSSPKRRFERW